jgi:hypothetical protein
VASSKDGDERDGMVGANARDAKASIMILASPAVSTTMVAQLER